MTRTTSPYEKLASGIHRTAKQSAKLSHQLPAEQAALNSIDRQLEQLYLDLGNVRGSGNAVNGLATQLKLVKRELNDVKNRCKDALDEIKREKRMVRQAKRDERNRTKTSLNIARLDELPQESIRFVIDGGNRSKRNLVSFLQDFAACTKFVARSYTVTVIFNHRRSRQWGDGSVQVLYSGGKKRATLDALLTECTSSSEPTVVITNDKRFSIRLAALGIKVMKSAVFKRLAAKMIAASLRCIDLSTNAGVFEYLRRQGDSSLEEAWHKALSAPASFDLCQQVMNGVLDLMSRVESDLESDPNLDIEFRNAECVDGLMIKWKVLSENGFVARFNSFTASNFQTRKHNHSRPFFSHVIDGCYNHDIFDIHEHRHCEDCVPSSVLYRRSENGQVTVIPGTGRQFVCHNKSLSHERRPSNLMLLPSDVVHAVSSVDGDGSEGCLTLVFLLPKEKTICDFFSSESEESKPFETQATMSHEDTSQFVRGLTHTVANRESTGFEVDFGY